MSNHPSDTGCSKARNRGYYGSCLECPFPECLEDNPELNLKQIRKKERLDEVRRLINQRLKPKQIAEKLGISYYTARGYIKESHEQTRNVG